MLRLEGLSYRYGGRAVLVGVDLDIAAGEVVSLIGPNGAGKSTLLKCINGILRHGAGRILLDGKPATSYSRRALARLVSYVPQQMGQAMSLPVIEMVMLGRIPHRGIVSGEEDRAVAMAVIEQLGLQSRAFRLFGELSGGERQLVIIARALAQQGRLMLLDEPTNNLDLRHQLETMALVRSVAKARNVAALIATHDLALAGRFSDSLALLGGGKLRARGPWQHVLTPENLNAVYGVEALIGSDQGMPYVIAVAAP